MTVPSKSSYKPPGVFVATGHKPLVMQSRGLSPVVASVVLLGLTVAMVSAIAVGVSGLGIADSTPADVSIDANADGHITVTHKGGSPLNMTEVDLTVRIDGDPLTYQPPVPFYAATGFENFPTGPFNAAASDQFSVGDTAALTIAETNDPTVTAGATVTVTFTEDGVVVAEASTTVR